MAAIIKIRNVGPIKEVDIDLNKINVFMGPQSSGKSTIAKIISYCTWVEKRRLSDGEFNEDVRKQLLKFHHLDENYFDVNSYFEYAGNLITISYNGKHLQKTEKIEVKEDKILEYKKTKNIYIPAERNFVSVVPNLKKYNETNDSILNLVYDWFSAKRNFTKEKSLAILNFEIDYYYQENADTDMLILNKSQKEISLDTASSGLQSITPLMVLLEFLTKNLYDEKHSLSVIETNYLNTLIKKILNSKINTDNRIHNLQNNRTKYHSAQFIIEEPEQNLFPETQRDLVCYLLNKMSADSREHRLTITTHSPYILYAMNNCMLGGLVSEKMKESDKEKIKCKNSFINPQEVSIYEIHDGVLKSIQQNDGLVSANYFDAKMKELMDDFYVMLNHYGE
jgi:energy-coupling factor transporter ATP-binding protein EcfA2